MVSLTGEELAELRAEKGEAAVKEHYRREEETVFGVGFARDPKTGKPVERGVGSQLQPSKNSVEAYEKWHRDAPDFASTLARMKSELATYEAKREAKRRGE